MTTTDDLLDMSVNDQKDELENLELEELKELREEEERSTALGNIDRELDRYQDEEAEANQHPQGQDTDTDDKLEDLEVNLDIDKLEELEAKVDYIISRCKTTSEEGFEDYYEN